MNKKARVTHRETWVEVTTEKRPWQKKYKKVILPVV